MNINLFMTRLNLFLMILLFSINTATFASPKLGFYCPQQIDCTIEGDRDSCTLIGADLEYWDNLSGHSPTYIYNDTYIFQGASTKCIHNGAKRCTYDMYDTVICTYVSSNHPESHLSLSNKINVQPQPQGGNWKKVWDSSNNGKGNHDICQSSDPFQCMLTKKSGFLVYVDPKNPQIGQIREIDIGFQRGVLPGETSYLLLDSMQYLKDDCGSQCEIELSVLERSPVAGGHDRSVSIGKIHVDLAYNTSYIVSSQLTRNYKIEKDELFYNTFKITIIQ